MARRTSKRRLTLAGRLRTKRARIAGVGIGAFAVVTSLLVVPGAIAGPEAPEVEEAVSAADRLAKRVKWGTCDADVLEQVPEAERKFYTCADQQVPLNHARPRGERISLALMRRTAQQPKRRIGTLVAANGGPGLSSRDLNAVIGSKLDKQVLDSFDIVSFDPRGVGGSTRVECFDNARDALAVFGEMRLAPSTDEEVSGTLKAYKRYGQACEQNAGKLPRHMSTQDIARDMEWVRAGLGERRLNYFGVSYGTLLGATYANLYPNRVRAMVLDSAVDPVTRTTNGLRQDQQRAAAHEDSLGAFLAACKEAGDACAFSSGDPRKKFDELRDHLRQQPVVLPGGTELDIHGFTAVIAGSLMSSAAFPMVATELQGLHDLINAPTDPSAQARTVPKFEMLKSAGAVTRFDVGAGATFVANTTDAADENPYQYYDAHFSINCSDKPFRHRHRDVPIIARQWERQSPTFARYQAFAEASACPVWPTKSPDRYSGPWNARTKNPALVLGGAHDPATPLSFAQRMTRSLHKARLLTVDDFGHGFAGLSTEGDKAIATYLTKLRLPAPGTKVKLDVPAFPK